MDTSPRSFQTLYTKSLRIQIEYIQRTNVKPKFWEYGFDTASFPLYTYSASVAVQALTVITMGTLADSPLPKKTYSHLKLSSGLYGYNAFLALPSESVI